MVYAYLEDVEPFFRHRKNTCIHLCYIAALSFQRHFDFSMQKYIFYIQENHSDFSEGNSQVTFLEILQKSAVLFRTVFSFYIPD